MLYWFTNFHAGVDSICACLAAIHKPQVFLVL